MEQALSREILAGQMLSGRVVMEQESLLCWLFPAVVGTVVLALPWAVIYACVVFFDS